jgi:hypothetical protein
VQQGSSLTVQFHNEQGLENLWTPSEGAPTEGFEAPAYAEQGLGDLWHESEPAETSGVDRGIYANRTLGNLWNSAL